MTSQKHTSGACVRPPLLDSIVNRLNKVMTMTFVVMSTTMMMDDITEAVMSHVWSNVSLLCVLEANECDSNPCPREETCTVVARGYECHASTRRPEVRPTRGVMETNADDKNAYVTSGTSLTPQSTSITADDKIVYSTTGTFLTSQSTSITERGDDASYDVGVTKTTADDESTYSTSESFLTSQSTSITERSDETNYDVKLSTESMSSLSSTSNADHVMSTTSESLEASPSESITDDVTPDTLVS